MVTEYNNEFFPNKKIKEWLAVPENLISFQTALDDLKEKLDKTNSLKSLTEHSSSTIQALLGIISSLKETVEKQQQEIESLKRRMSSEISGIAEINTTGAETTKKPRTENSAPQFSSQFFPLPSQDPSLTTNATSNNNCSGFQIFDKSVV